MKRHAEHFRTSRALGLFSWKRRFEPAARLNCVRADASFCGRHPGGRTAPTDEERRSVKAPRDPRARRRRAPIKRTPQELAWARQDALRWRAALRAERNGAGAAVVVAEPADPANEMQRDRDAEQRAHFAAAIARAEFGRFYFKVESDKATKAGKPRRNGKAPNGAG
jgi:hypothetical protein